MFIQFSVGNFRSIQDIVTLSMNAAPLAKLADMNIFSFETFTLLKSVAIYGSNASGKSNLIKAFEFMKSFVLHSSKESQATESINVERFRLSTTTEKMPSFFEAVFICDGKKYRYGFEVDRQKVHSEWLFYGLSKHESKLFIRDGEQISISRPFKEGKGLQTKTRPNALFLSVVAQFNGAIATQILQWFESVGIISGLDDRSYNDFTYQQLSENGAFRQFVLTYLHVADFGIRDIAVENIKVRLADLPEHLKESFKKFTETDELDAYSTSFLHTCYNDVQQPVALEKFDLEYNESEGTQKFLKLLGPLSEAITGGKTLLIDELDARLHPMLTRFLIQLFHSNETNPRHAQLIFATHDINLLTNEIFREDQIWFVEKNQYGASELYSLVEFKHAQKKNGNGSSFRKDYLLGKYGAIPFIGDVELLSGIEQQ